MNATPDGYIAARGDDIGWSVPSAELHQWFNDRAREIGVSLYGRKLWEVMSAHWPTADQQPDATPVEVEFARVWQKTPKVVFSATLDEVSGNARPVTGDAVLQRAGHLGEPAPRGDENLSGRRDPVPLRIQALTCSGASSTRLWCMHCQCCSATGFAFVAGWREDGPRTDHQCAVGRHHHPPLPRPQPVRSDCRKTPDHHHPLPARARMGSVITRRSGTNSSS